MYPAPPGRGHPSGKQSDVTNAGRISKQRFCGGQAPARPRGTAPGPPPGRRAGGGPDRSRGRVQVPPGVFWTRSGGRLVVETGDRVYAAADPTWVVARVERLRTDLRLDAARGSILVFVDDDCELDSGYLRELERHYAEDETLAIRGGRVELGNPNDLPFTIKRSTIGPVNVIRRSASRLTLLSRSADP
jgi:hypothetical protein